MNRELLDQIERIGHKLRTVPTAQGRSHSFGEETHRFQLNPPLSEQQIRNFEHQHRIRLPEGYRLFLLHLGNGGAGPYYGLLPLSGAFDVAYEKTEGYLARPCPLVPGIPQEQNWLEQLGCSSQECYQGAISIVHRGCAYYSLLVVSGSARGRVVNVDEDLHPPDFPEDQDFLSWYERWLDEMALGYGLCFDVPGDETVLRNIFISATEPTERRARAVRSLFKLPTLTSESHGPLRSALAKGDLAGLREAAALALGHFRVEAAVSELRLATGDSDSGVRKAALAALFKIGANSSESEARCLLADPDADVVFEALYRLNGAGLLRFEDLHPLLLDVSPRVRRYAVYFLGKSIQVRGSRVESPDELGKSLDSLNSRLGWSSDRPNSPLVPEEEQALRTALKDPEDYVRILAIQAIRDLRPQSFLEILEEMRQSEQDSTVQSNVAIAISSLHSESK
jgi:HEAT repeat protein